MDTNGFEPNGRDDNAVAVVDDGDNVDDDNGDNYSLAQCSLIFYAFESFLALLRSALSR